MEEVMYSSGRKGSGPPDIRLVHFNDVYHIEASDREPVGGAARFVSLVNSYRNGDVYKDQTELLTFFSGDAYNPSLESSVTKGKHMPPILNTIGTDVACAGNHDFDFGAENFASLMKMCTFPWLMANVDDPQTNEPMGNCQRTIMLTASNGLKIGVIGLVEREWLATVNSIAPDIIYKSATATARELVPQLRKGGADIVVCVAHQREPNDEKLAKLTAEDGLIDIILGGYASHDHYYSHKIVNGVHILRSGSDFKQLSYIEAWKKADGKGWDFDITRRDVTKHVSEDPGTLALVGKLTSGLKTKLNKPIGFTAVPLDARFSVVRTAESNIGNFVCDLMRYYYHTDCAIMAAGTIRGDVVYEKGILRLRDIIDCFPFEDPCVVIECSGHAILAALENSLSLVPALEGRFPQVSNIFITYDPSGPSNKRIKSLEICGEPVGLERKYTLATRDYMRRGKDGFESLTEESGCTTIIDDEAGVLISTILRQYFLSLKIMGRWKKGSMVLKQFDGVKEFQAQKGELREDQARKPKAENDSDDDSDDEDEIELGDREIEVAKQVGRKWERLALGKKLQSDHGKPAKEMKEFELPQGTVDCEWCMGIAPKLEGRIKVV